MSGRLDITWAIDEAWQSLDQRLRTVCASIGMQPEEVDQLLGRLKPIFLKHLVPQSGAITCAPGLPAQVRDLLRGVLAGLFMELAMREAVLMRAGLKC